MVNQLLAMARAEDREQAPRAGARSTWPRLTMDAVRDFVPQAMETRIDLGYEGPADRRTHDACAASRCCCANWCATWSTTRCTTRRPGGTVTARVMTDPFGQVRGAAGRGQRPRHPGGRARERVPALLPRAGHRGRRQRPGPGHRARDRAPARRRRSRSTTRTARPAPGSGPGPLFTVRFPLQLPEARGFGPGRARALSRRRRALAPRSARHQAAARATDIRMPSPRPSVTIAVPP